MAKSRAQELPSIQRNHTLWLLKHEVGDDRFLQIFGDFAGLIRRSEKACEKAARSDNADYAQFVAESEAEYLEEIIGASFLVLQAKIRRVCSATERLRKFAQTQHSIELGGLDGTRIRKLTGRYKTSGPSLIELVWAVGNYYKHRDEWDHSVWRSKKANEAEPNWLRQARGTRKMAKRVGIVEFSTGNMRTAYEYFGIDPYSKCEQLAKEVQQWSERVYHEAQRLTKKAAARS
jgi:hypothetical protein